MKLTTAGTLLGLALLAPMPSWAKGGGAAHGFGGEAHFSEPHSSEPEIAPHEGAVNTTHENEERTTQPHSTSRWWYWWHGAPAATPATPAPEDKP
jgi:hypothetical protein